MESGAWNTLMVNLRCTPPLYCVQVRALGPVTPWLEWNGSSAPLAARNTFLVLQWYVFPREMCAPQTHFPSHFCLPNRYHLGQGFPIAKTSVIWLCFHYQAYTWIPKNFYCVWYKKGHYRNQFLFWLFLLVFRVIFLLAHNVATCYMHFKVTSYFWLLLYSCIYMYILCCL